MESVNWEEDTNDKSVLQEFYSAKHEKETRNTRLSFVASLNGQRPITVAKGIVNIYEKN